MGLSFYLLRKCGELRDRSQSFSDLINASAESYGLTSEQAVSYRSLNDSYVASYVLSEAPETRTVGTLMARNDAKQLLKEYAAQLAKIISGTPTVTNAQKANLGLSVRATRTPMPPPGTCSDFKVELLNDGSVKLTWKANNAKRMTGVTYQVWRRFGGAGEFSFVGRAG